MTFMSEPRPEVPGFWALDGLPELRNQLTEVSLCSADSLFLGIETMTYGWGSAESYGIWILT